MAQLNKSILTQRLAYKSSSKPNLSSGYSIIEVIIAMGLAMIVVPVIILGAVTARDGKLQQTQRVQAVALASEASEVIKALRNDNWSNISANGVFHPTITNGNWVFASGSEVVDGFTRSITISDVNRDASGNIVTTGGTLDPSTKKITLTVTWEKPYTSSVSFPHYVTRYENLARIETTEAHFNAGTINNTVVTNTSGGEVILGGGGRSDWCSPTLNITPLDLPRNGEANALTAIEGKVSAGTGSNASGVSFANVVIGDTNPPTATVTNTFDGYKTNGVFGESSHAYLATDNNSKEVVIIDLTANPLAESGYFNAPGNSSATSVVTSGNVGYALSGSKLYTFDLSSYSGSRPQLGDASLSSTGIKVAVVGSYAYVVNNGTSTQLQIINVSNPSSLSVVAQASLPAQGGVDIFVNADGSRAYVATAVSGSQSELFIVNTSTKSGDLPIISSYESNGMNPKGVTVVTGNRAILVGNSGEEYQVINLNTESAPTHCGGLNIDTGVNGVASVVEADGDAYSYIITGDTSSELKIIEGGPGGQSTTSGNFESAVFDPGIETAFNRVSMGVTLPALTGATYQISSKDAVGGSCVGVSPAYIGPDGTADTFYGVEALKIPMNNDGSGFENPGRCFQYKLFLTSSDAAATPIFNDLTINYSP